MNKLQSVCGTATLDDLRFAIKLLQEAKESSDDGLFFKSGLFNWNKMEMLTVTDASFGNESNFRSQKGRMTFLTGPDSFDKNGMGVHLVEFVGLLCKLSQTGSKSPCDSAPPWQMHMVCSCVQDGNITLPVSCVTCG